MKLLCKIDENHAVYQYSDGFRFGTDSVLLAGFVRCGKSDVGVEFGTGSGIVSILLALHKHFRKIYAIEVQPDYAALAAENAALCGFSDQIDVIEDDLKHAAKRIREPVDFVFCNPPYMAMTDGAPSDRARRANCRHEALCTIDDVCRFAAQILKDRGSLYLVFRAARLAQLFCAMRAHAIEPKNLLPVAARAGKNPSLVLVRGVKAGKAGLLLEKPLLLEDKDGQPSADYTLLYEKGKIFYGENQ